MTIQTKYLQKLLIYDITNPNLVYIFDRRKEHSHSLQGPRIHSWLHLKLCVSTNFYLQTLLFMFRLPF